MRSEADDGRPETSPDTGARRNSPNKDSSSKKLSNTPLPIHRCPQVQARKQRRRPPLRHDATRRCRGRRRGCRRNRGAGSQRTIRGLTEATETALRRDDSSGRTTIRPGPRRLSSFLLSPSGMATALRQRFKPLTQGRSLAARTLYCLSVSSEANRSSSCSTMWSCMFSSILTARRKTTRLATIPASGR